MRERGERGAGGGGGGEKEGERINPTALDQTEELNNTQGTTQPSY